MKLYRIIGSVLSSLIALVLVFALFGSLIIGGISAVVSEETVRKLSASLVKDDNVRSVAKDALMKIDFGGSGTLSEENVDALLNSAAVQDGLSKIAAEAITASLTDSNQVDVSSTVSEMIEAEPELFDDVLENMLMNDETSYDDVYEKLTGVTAPSEDEPPVGEVEVPVPEYGASLSELASSWIASNPDELNDIIASYLSGDFSLEDFLSDGIAFDEIPEEELTVSATPEKGTAGVAALFSADPTSPEFVISLLKTLLNTNPFVIILISVGLLAATYLLASLLTWSFRTSLIFAGVVSLFGGLLTFVLSLLPVLQIVDGVANFAEVVTMAVELLWTLLAQQLLLFGIIFMVLGAGIIVAYVLTKGKKKDTAAA